MTLSYREQALTAFKAKLDELAADGVTVLRNPDIEIQREQMPCAAMYDGGDDVEYDASDIQRHAMRVDVECYVKANTDGELGAAMSDLYAKVTKKIFTDRTLGLSFVIDIQNEGPYMNDPTIVRDDGRISHAGFPLHYRVIYETAAGEP